jgi:hypothetical protein
MTGVTPPTSWQRTGPTRTPTANFQLPVRALGYKPVLDYKIDQLGVQTSFGGMLQIEGAWYCPSMPEVLVSATADLRGGRIECASASRAAPALDLHTAEPDPSA